MTPACRTSRAISAMCSGELMKARVRNHMVQKVEAAHVGLERHHVPGAHLRQAVLGARPCDRGVLLARHEHRAGAGGEIDHHVAAAVANARDDFAI